MEVPDAILECEFLAVHLELCVEDLHIQAVFDGLLLAYSFGLCFRPVAGTNEDKSWTPTTDLKQDRALPQGGEVSPCPKQASTLVMIRQPVFI